MFSFILTKEESDFSKFSRLFESMSFLCHKFVESKLKGKETPLSNNGFDSLRSSIPYRVFFLQVESDFNFMVS